MGVDESTICDINSLSDLEQLDDLSDNFSDYGLCVPQDPIESLEWYPSFSNGLMSMNDLYLDPVCLFSSEDKKQKRTPFTDCNFDHNKEEKKKRGIERLAALNFSKKKQRSKRPVKQRPPSSSSWNMKVFSSVENESVYKEVENERAYKEESSVENERVYKEVENEREESERRCTHCNTNKTPQWRIGPKGPKTLCNACGVRFKSGRLLDEYRPAASPTFNSKKHSNFHKRVMNIRSGRKEKEEDMKRKECMIL